MSASRPRIIRTGDGSQSLFLESLNETYHSNHGAVQETLHVFIRNGLELLQDRKEVEVFEIGFGTGLNAICAMQFAEQNNLKIRYSTIELFPISSDIYRLYNKTWLEGEGLWSHFLDLHTSAWDSMLSINQHFSFIKYNQDWLEYRTESKFDIIFYDAFAPGKQPEMWSLNLLKKAHQMLSEEGILITYCAQGQFKRNLLASGFKVETLTGPPGKKEIVRALKI